MTKLRNTWNEDCPDGADMGGNHPGSKRRILFTLLGLVLLFLLWLFRPSDAPVHMPDDAATDTFRANAMASPVFTVEEAEVIVRRAELSAGPLRADNHARIVWNPAYRGRKAPCSIVYLHGFTASYGEGAPVHARVARELGCHLYISRLHGHGLRTDEPLAEMRADSLLYTAVQALAIGNHLGEHVILMGNSMGGTLALYLAGTYTGQVDALVLFAPLIEFASPLSPFFEATWAQRLFRLLTGSPYLHNDPDNDDHARYWYMSFHVGSLAALQVIRKTLLDDDLYQRINQPVFAGYYYKNEDKQDDLVSVAAIRNIEDRLGTSPDRRLFQAFPEAENHVITSAYRSAEHAQVSDALIRFLQHQLPEL
ncbi:MAG: alpha/beta hydrolase [Bacteroidota bacterium]